MLSKPSSAKRKPADPRNFRRNISDLFLSGAVSAKRARSIFSDAVHANAEHVADLNVAEDKNYSSQLAQEDGQESQMAQALYSPGCYVRPRDTDYIKEVPGHHAAP